MKKRISAIICVVAMMFSIFPLTAYAIPKGKLEGVDYTRIQYSDKSYDVRLTLDNLEFWGKLECGTDLSADEIDGIIRKVMTDKKITSGMLINAVKLISDAENVEGFSMNDVQDALLKLTGLDAAVDLYNLLMGTDPRTPGEVREDLMLNYLSGKAGDYIEDVAEKALTQGGKVAMKAGGKVAFKLMFLLPDLTEIGVAAMMKYENIKITVALGLEKKLMLDDFYAECGKRLAESSGGAEWRISFAGPKGRGVTEIHNFNMWGVGGLMSEWTLTGELTRSELGAGDGYAGTYQGDLVLEINGVDMKDFDNRYLDGMPLVKTALASEKAGRGIDYKDIANTPTVLKRNTTGSVEIVIPQGSGTFEASVNGALTNKNDTVTFNFDHIISGIESKGIQEDFLEYTIKSADPESYVFYQKAWMIQHLPVLGSQRTDLMDNGPHTVPADIGTVWKPLESASVITVYLK